MKRILSKIRAVVSHPAFLATAGVLLLVWLLARNLKPVIERVPVVVPGGALMIEGRGFGSRQGSSSVLVAAEDGVPTERGVERVDERKNQRTGAYSRRHGAGAP